MASFFKSFIIVSLLVNNAFAAEWELPPHQFSVSGEGRAPQIGSDALGNAIAVWEDVVDTDPLILSSFFNRNTFTWGPPTLISDLGTFAPALKVNSSGMAIAAFKESITPAVEANVYKDGNWLGIEPFVDQGVLSNPIVAINNNGMGVIAWISSLTGVRAVVCNNGVFSQVKTVYSALTSTATAISLSINDKGVAVLAWIDPEEHVRFSQLQGLDWTSPAVISKEAGNSHVNIGIDGEGDSIIVFQRNTGIRFMKSAKGVWMDGHEISAPNLPEDPSTNAFPKLVVDAGGTAFAIWNRVNKNKFNGSFFDGVQWKLSEGVSINPDSEYNIVNDHLKNTLVTYTFKPDNGGYQVRSTFYNPGLNWSTPQTIVSSDVPLKKPQPSVSSIYHTAFAVWEAGAGTDAFGSFSPLMIPPTPPSSLTAKLKKDRFPSQTNRVHILRWNQTTDVTALFYRLKQGKNVIAEFPLQGQSEIVLNNRERKEATTYSLSAVNALGEEGAPNKVSIR